MNYPCCFRGDVRDNVHNKMGANASRRPEPEVHVVVVQSQENGQMDAKVIRKTLKSSRKLSARGLFHTSALHLHVIFARIILFF